MTYQNEQPERFWRDGQEGGLMRGADGDGAEDQAEHAHRGCTEEE